MRGLRRGDAGDCDPRLRAHSRLADTALALLAVGTIALVVSVLRSPASSPDASAAAPVLQRAASPSLSPPRTPLSSDLSSPPGGAPISAASPRAAPTLRALFLGDSVTGGTPPGAQGARGYPAQVGAALGWQALVNAQSGTGFVATGTGGQPFGDRVPAVVGLHPDVVVILGGRSDAGRGGVLPAAAAALRALRAGLPPARVVLVSPPWLAATPPPPPQVALRDALAAAAAAVPGVDFVDTLAEGWFTGADPGLVTAGKVYPTNAGYRHLAELLADDLRRLGVRR